MKPEAVKQKLIAMTEIVIQRTGRKITGEFDGNLEGKKVVVPHVLFKKFSEIMEVELQARSADSDLHFISKKYKVELQFYGGRDEEDNIYFQKKIEELIDKND